MLGIVDTRGTVRFRGSRVDCRAFLQRMGLREPTTATDLWKGWHNATHAGAIYYDNGEFHAAIWRAEG